MTKVLLFILSETQSYSFLFQNLILIFLPPPPKCMCYLPCGEITPHYGKQSGKTETRKLAGVALNG